VKQAWPRKRFGQHFLESAWIDKLVAALDVRPDDTFLEIGPGRGALTKPLAAKVRRVIAVEIDRDLASSLAAHRPPNVRIILGDFLGIDLNHVLADETRPIRVVGNLPYNVSSPILFRLLRYQQAGQQVQDATVMLQREVAQRVAGVPDTRAYGPLAIHIALHADVEQLMTVPPGAFRPQPKVTSAVLRLRFHPPRVDIGQPEVFERVVRGVFLQRRKTLANAFRPVADSFGRSARQVLESVGIDATRRPATLTLGELGRLSRAVL
jgi:16S rRNA (adenine1518-N6/adenine1519-N6)-dimethyltransferase